MAVKSPERKFFPQCLVKKQISTIDFRVKEIKKLLKEYLQVWQQMLALCSKIISSSAFPVLLKSFKHYYVKISGYFVFFKALLKIISNHLS